MVRFFQQTSYSMYHFESGPLVGPLRQDQSFTLTGSTIGSLVHLLHNVSEQLLIHPYVHVIALDFFKAFDSLRHISLTDTMNKFKLDDQPYNWACEFLEGRNHSTQFNHSMSTFTDINASVVQGSPLGPVSFILNMVNLTPLHSVNIFSKYADDCHLIVPATASSTIPDEINHINDWAKSCNLRLNVVKTKEVIFTRPRFDRTLLPPPLPNIERVSSINILGILMTQDLSFQPHVQKVLSKGHQLFYSLKILKAHGLIGTDLHRVTTTLMHASIFYASPAWFGFLSQTEIKQLNALIRKMFKWGFTLRESPTFEQLCEEYDSNLFSKILHNPNHALYHLLPPPHDVSYNFRPRPHNRVLPSTSSTLTKKNFMQRMIFKNSY